jgi:hypothetical protein
MYSRMSIHACTLHTAIRVDLANQDFRPEPVVRGESRDEDSKHLFDKNLQRFSTSSRSYRLSLVRLQIRKNEFAVVSGSLNRVHSTHRLRAAAALQTRPP